MKLKFEVRDQVNRPIGTTVIGFDWKGRGWAVAEDKSGAWNRVSSRKIGRFEFKEWGVMWMFDNVRKFAIVHDSPQGAMDMNRTKSTARLFDPVDPSLKDAHALWELEMAAASRWRVINTQALPFDRSAYINRLNSLFPAPYDVSKDSSNYALLTNTLKKDNKVVLATPNYTTCGSLPGFISRQVALSKGLKGTQYEAWMNKYSLEGTNRVRDIGLAYNCWVEAASDKKPKQGDIYALLNSGLTDRRTSGISHVGVFEKETGNQWTTFDLGQAGGFDGKKNTREYKAATTQLTGEANQGGGMRTVAGWVDLERYFKLG
jgi:hypothetical protein